MQEGDFFSDMGHAPSAGKGALCVECQSVMPCCALAAVRVLRMSIAMVMGPTPPGTGVMAQAFGSTAAKSTSPQSLPF